MKTDLKIIAKLFKDYSTSKNVSSYEYFVEDKVNTSYDGNILTNTYKTRDKNGDVVETREEIITSLDGKEVYRTSIAEDIETHKLTYYSKITDSNGKIIEYSNNGNIESKTTTILDIANKRKEVTTLSNFSDPDGNSSSTTIITVTDPLYYENILKSNSGIIIKRKNFDDKGRITSIISSNSKSPYRIKTFTYDSDDDITASDIVDIIKDENGEPIDTTYEKVVHKMDSKFKYQFNKFYDKKMHIRNEILTLTLIGKKSEYFTMSGDDRNITFYDRSKGLILKIDKSNMYIEELYVDMQQGDEQLFVKMGDFTIEYKYSNKGANELIGSLTLGIEIDQGIVMSILNGLYKGKLPEHLDLAAVKKVYDSIIWEK